MFAIDIDMFINGHFPLAIWIICNYFAFKRYVIKAVFI